MNHKLNALIVDDEELSRSVLSDYLNEYCEDIDIIGYANNVMDAVKEINSKSPKIVFLDIEMPGGNGFELFDYFKDPDFVVVFVTAYENYATRAFQVSALDYLTKPIKIKQLVKTVQRAKHQINLIDYAKQIEYFKNNLTQEITRRIALPHATGVHFFNIDDIIFIEADESYSKIKYDDAKEALISKKLGEIEKSVNNPVLFKPHRSYLINMNHVREFNRQDGDFIIMKCGTEIPLSRYRKDDFFEKIKNLD